MNFTLNKFRAACLLAFCGLLGSTAWAQKSFYLHDGDRVVFYGDSITEQQLYTTNVEVYAFTRFPQLKLSFVNAGVGGDRVSGGWAGTIDLRLQRDVIAYSPTVVTVMLGMNDGEYQAFDQSTFDRYASGYRHIVEKLRSALPNVRMTLIQPSAYDDVTRPAEFTGGYNAVLLRYSAFVKQLAGQQGFTATDMNTPLVHALEEANALNPVAAKVIIPDRIHPSEIGHWVMALALLKSWNAPSLVTDVELNGGSAAGYKATNTTVSDLVKTPAGLTWTQLDKALPLPISLSNGTDEITDAVSDLFEELDQEMLQVTGLAPGNYELRIDNQKIAQFSEGELSKGINLAEYDTPMQGQAFDVMLEARHRNNLHWERLPVFTAQPPLQDQQAALQFISEMEQREEESERKSAQPQMRKYELRRIGEH